jgi:hypothetical protein
MVYSTAKPTVADQVKSLGLQLAGKKVEIREGSEVADALKGDLHSSPSPSAHHNSSAGRPAFTGRMTPNSGASSSAPALGGTVKAAAPNTIGGQHPIYALMDQGHEKSSSKKKIVIPPRGKPPLLAMCSAHPCSVVAAYYG